MSAVIKVFEYDKLICEKVYSEVSFTEKHLIALQKFNTINENKYFTLIHDGIRFKNYVGVLKVANLTIEILPKVDKKYTISSDDKLKENWKNLMLQMLKKSGFINITSISNADLRLRNTSLLDIYIQEYLEEVSLLLRKGLRKKYRLVEENTGVLKVFSSFIFEL